MADASAAGPQHVEADVNIVARLYEALARQDAKMLLETADPNIEWVAMEGFPHGGTKRGFEATFHEYFPSFMQYFTEWSAEPFKIRQDWRRRPRDRELQRHNKGQRGSLHPPLRTRWTVRAGKVARLHQFTDTAQLAEKLAAASAKRTASAFREHLGLLGKDMNRWIGLWAENAVMEFPFAPSANFSAKLEGKQAIWAVMSELPKQLKDLTFSNIQVSPMADPETAIVTFDSTATMAATGRPYQQSYIGRVRVKEGKIASYVETEILWSSLELPAL